MYRYRLASSPGSKVRTFTTTPASPVGQPSASTAAASSQGASGVPHGRELLMASGNGCRRAQSQRPSRFTPSGARSEATGAAVVVEVGTVVVAVGAVVVVLVV